MIPLVRLELWLIVLQCASVFRGRQEPEPAGRLHGVSVKIHPLQLCEAAGHPVVRQWPLQWLQYRLEVRGGKEAAYVITNWTAAKSHWHCFYCVSVLNLTATATTLPSLVWPRKSRCLNTAQWSRTQWTSTTLSTKWPAIPKSGRFEHRWSEKKQHFFKMNKLNNDNNENYYHCCWYF